jgi:hypothetical protein
VDEAWDDLYRREFLHPSIYAFTLTATKC